MKKKISTKGIVEAVNAPQYEFPKYTTQVINLVNSNAGGTRPKVVGQMSDLIQEFPGKTIQEWIGKTVGDLESNSQQYRESKEQCHFSLFK